MCTMSHDTRHVAVVSNENTCPTVFTETERETPDVYITWLWPQQLAAIILLMSTTTLHLSQPAHTLILSIIYYQLQHLSYFIRTCYLMSKKS